MFWINEWTRNWGGLMEHPRDHPAEKRTGGHWENRHPWPAMQLRDWGTPFRHEIDDDDDGRRYAAVAIYHSSERGVKAKASQFASARAPQARCGKFHPADVATVEYLHRNSSAVRHWLPASCFPTRRWPQCRFIDRPISPCFGRSLTFFRFFRWDRNRWKCRSDNDGGFHQLTN